MDGVCFEVRSSLSSAKKKDWRPFFLQLDFCLYLKSIARLPPNGLLLDFRLFMSLFFLSRFRSVICWNFFFIAVCCVLCVVCGVMDMDRNCLHFFSNFYWNDAVKAKAFPIHLWIGHGFTCDEQNENILKKFNGWVSFGACKAHQKKSNLYFIDRFKWV